MRGIRGSDLRKAWSAPGATCGGFLGEGHASAHPSPVAMRDMQLGSSSPMPVPLTACHGDPAKKSPRAGSLPDRLLLRDKHTDGVNMRVCRLLP